VEVISRDFARRGYGRRSRPPPEGERSVALFEAPNDVSVAVVVLAVAGGGVLSSVETTVLLTVEETLEALRQAGEIKYWRPGDKG
jgi:hypothetical protein